MKRNISSRFHWIRKDMMAVSALLLLLSLALYIIPINTSTVITSDSFVPSQRTGWYSAGEIYLPVGDALKVSFSSDLPVTLGFVSAESWVNFNNGTGQLVFLSFKKGLYGEFSIMAYRSEYIFLIANWSNNETPVFDATITAVDAHGYLPYSLLSLAGGLALLAASIIYEPLKRRLRREIP